mmetsp:Transcript_57082/g.131369  ORF Transcript_57082/g.131369 Transcript_57082/m.131369 type:complete len:219 (-) Transcript_57082:95-751(-)
MTSPSLLASTGYRPKTTTCTSMPRLQISAAAPYGLETITSGANTSGLPHRVVASAPSCRVRERPKSHRHTRPCTETIRLAAFRSRWRKPGVAEWRKFRARVQSPTMRVVSGRLTVLPCFAMPSMSPMTSLPSRNSITVTKSRWPGPRCQIKVSTISGVSPWGLSKSDARRPVVNSLIRPSSVRWSCPGQSLMATLSPRLDWDFQTIPKAPAPRARRSR